jgi:hypothetical protein
MRTASAERLRYPNGVRGLGLLCSVFGFAAVSCGSPDAPANLLIVRFDAGADASDAGVEESADASAADANPYLGAPCVDDGQCNDMIACTYDSCDPGTRRCLNVPDNTLCDDGIYCDGQEQCVPLHGCEPGTIVTCSVDACEISKCVEATKSCERVVRDVDQDGDPDEHCMGGHDCNDLNPNVSSLHAEVCSNGIDDNCNGLIDEMPCVAAPGDTCADAALAPGEGTYALSTLGCDKTFATSCSVSNPAGGQNVVAAVTVPPGPNVDLDVWATTTGVEVAVALQSMCGQASTELGCGSGQGATSVRARARNVAPGTYYAVVTTQSATDVELKVVFLTPTPPATNVDCASASPIVAGTPTTVSIVDPPTDLPSACTEGGVAFPLLHDLAPPPTTSTGELTYSFTLTAAQDVVVSASAVQGSGTPIIGLRDPTCTGAGDELSCRRGSAVPIFEPSLPAGTYVLTVAATSPIDASVLVQLAPPTPAAADQSCASPPAIASNATLAFDLSDHSDAIKDGCSPGNPNAAYDLTLSGASDVLLVERVADADQGAVSLDPPACTMNIACSTGSTPVRVGKRNVAAGDYRAVVADQLGLQGTLDALVRPTAAPTIIPAGGADTCATAVDASAGGFFTGDTSTAQGNYSSPCDDPNTLPGGTPDQVLALTLTTPQRVVLDMEGSDYTTILDVRQGPSCPGTPVPSGCYVGFTAQRSFLDLELQAGQYWIIVDGYADDRGSWDLDVRVLPP